MGIRGTGPWLVGLLYNYHPGQDTFTVRDATTSKAGTTGWGGMLGHTKAQTEVGEMLWLVVPGSEVTV